ncbi:MAG: hypothetical protein PHG99_02870 [Erysipelotrichaceae bacterium]|nr:hypothetical protein [Erysipelotrichaceae bacterium]
MIKKAQDKDIDQLKKIYDECYGVEFRTFYFDHVFKPFNTYVIANEDDEIIFTISVNRHPVWIADKKLNISYLTGLYVKDHLILKKALSEVIDEMEHNDLLTFIDHKDHDHFKEFGFDVSYQMIIYTLERSQISMYSNKGISDKATVLELRNIYQKFTNYFNGYQHRDSDHYQMMMKWLDASHHRLLTYRNDNDDLEGYIVYYDNIDKIIIKDFIYLNSIAFIKLLDQSLQLRGISEFSLPKQLDISKILPNITGKMIDTINVRLNDRDLFNRLYNTNILNINEVMALSKKPLFFNESY